MERLCPVCKETPLHGKQKTCSSACRSAKYRATQKPEQTSDTSQVQTEQQLPEQSGRKRAVGSKTRAMAHRKTTQVEQPILAVMEQLLSEMAELHSLVSRITTEPRVDMRTQVTTRAPDGAVGYRLVLPNRNPAIPPKIIPRRKSTDSKSYYSLVPFEYPDDLRLCDGCWYRIVWIDSQGNRIRAERDAPIPGLCFVVGPVGQTQSVSIVQTGTERSATAALPNVLSADDQALTESPSVMEIPSVTAARCSTPDALAETPSVETTETVTEGPAQTESPSVTPLPSETETTPDSSPPPAIPASSDEVASVPIESVAVTETAETPPVNLPGNPFAAPLWPGTLVPNTDGTLPPSVKQKPQRDSFWDGPGKFAKQLESLAQVLYEQRLSAAQEASLPLPEEPLTQLSREERKEIRRAASHPFWKALGVYLNRRFARAKRKGIGAVASLPIVPTPLDDKDKRLMDEVLASPDKRVYLDYLYARRDALLVGDVLPKEPSSKLSTAQRKRLAKIVADVRPIAELLSNEEE